MFEIVGATAAKMYPFFLSSVAHFWNKTETFFLKAKKREKKKVTVV